MHGEHFGERAERERFLTVDETQALKSRFQDLVSAAMTKNPKPPTTPRLILFIDDLDRCLPEQVIPLLESLKLHLNLLGTVCFLGVDPRALRAAIQQRYASNPGFTEVDYLDKIVQLRFDVPPIRQEDMAAYCTHLLPPGLRSAADLIGETLQRNPRAVKRFINRLELAMLLAPNLDPTLLAGVQLIQQLDPLVFRWLADSPDLLRDLAADDSDLEVLELDGTPHQPTRSVNALLRRVAKDIPNATRPGLARYFHLAEATGHTEGLQNAGATWVDGTPEEFLDERSLLRHRSTLRKVGRVEADAWFLLLQNSKQRTWLLRTSDARIVCFLDSPMTR